MIPASDLMLLSAALFAIGVYGVLARRNAILVLISVELMLNAANLNLVAVASSRPAIAIPGQVMAVLAIGVGAAEIGVGLAVILSLFRRRRTVNVDDIDLLRW